MFRRASSLRLPHTQMRRGTAGRLLSTSGGGGSTPEGLKRALRMAAESTALVLIAALVYEAVDRAVPSKTVDLRQAPFKAIVEQKRSQIAEYSELMKAGDKVAADLLAKITKKQRPIADIDMEQLLINLLGEPALPENQNGEGEEEDQEEDEEATKEVSAAMGGRSLALLESKLKPGDFKERYRVLSLQERSEALKSLAVHAQAGINASTAALSVQVLSLAAAKQVLLLDDLHDRFLQLEDYMEHTLEDRLMQTVNPAEAQTRFVLTELSQLVAASGAAVAAHRFWSSGRAGSSTYNSSGSVSPRGFVDAYSENIRRLQELCQRPTSAWLQLLRKWRLRDAKNKGMPFVFLGLATWVMVGYSQSKSEIALLQPPSNMDPVLTTLLAPPIHEVMQKFIKRPLLQQSSGSGKEQAAAAAAAISGEAFEPLEEEEMVVTPAVWPGATKQDPFHETRMLMELVQAPILENALYRGVIFNRMLAHAVAVAGPATGPAAGAWVALAHVFSALAAALPSRQPLTFAQVADVPVPERQLVFSGFAWALFLQTVYRASGSLLLVTLYSSLYNAALLAYEYSARGDFVRPLSSVYGLASELHVQWFKAFLLPVDGGRVVLGLPVEAWTSPLYWAVRVNGATAPFRRALGLHPAESVSPPHTGIISPAEITPEQIRALAARAMEAYSDSPTTLDPAGIVSLLVALEAAVAHADTRPFDFGGGVQVGNFSDAEDWHGGNVRLQRLLVDAQLLKQRPALREAMGAEAFQLRQQVQVGGNPPYRLLSSSPQTAAKGVCLQHTLASQADATAFNLDVKMRAVLQRFPRGLTQPQLEAVLAHILKSAVMSDVRLDYSVFSATLFRWQAASQATEGEAFLDVVDGFWRSSLAGAEAAAQRFENAHVFATSVELAGRPLTVEDARAIEDRRSIFVRAALMSEAALYLQIIGLAPAEYARLLQRQRTRRPECAKLDDDWRSFMESDAAWRRKYSVQYARRLTELKGLRTRRPVSEEAMLRR